MSEIIKNIELEHFYDAKVFQLLEQKLYEKEKKDGVETGLAVKVGVPGVFETIKVSIKNHDLLDLTDKQIKEDKIMIEFINAWALPFVKTSGNYHSVAYSFKSDDLRIVKQQSTKPMIQTKTVLE